MPRSVLFLAALVLAASSGPVLCATLVPNTLSDVVGDDGLCSLREAIIAANANAPSGFTAGECPSGSSGSTDRIELGAGTYELTLANAAEDAWDLDGTVNDLDVFSSLEIFGLGINLTRIDANNLFRALHLEGATISVVMKDLEIRSGSSDLDGGGILADDVALLRLERVRIRDSSADDDGGALGLYGESFELVEVELLSNVADDLGGAIHWLGWDRLEVERSKILGNQANGTFAKGGGIYANAGFGDVLLITESEVSSNIASDDGGGVWADADTTIVRSTIAQNSGERGGGIFFSDGTQRIENSTVSGNHASDTGGGIAELFSDPIVIVHSTIAGNTAPTGSAIADGEEVSLSNSIVSGTCAGSFATSSGGNIESPGDNCGLNQLSDLVAVSPTALALGDLMDNGGPTSTHLPASNSAALGHATAFGCQPTDQRGVARPQGGSCDTGAVEFDASAIFNDGFESGSTTAWN